VLGAEVRVADVAVSAVVFVGKPIDSYWLRVAGCEFFGVYSEFGAFVEDFDDIFTKPLFFGRRNSDTVVDAIDLYRKIVVRYVGCLEVEEFNGSR
jgi:hypothetical protein